MTEFEGAMVRGINDDNRITISNLRVWKTIYHNQTQILLLLL